MPDFLASCIHHFFVVFWSSYGNKKMQRYMDEIKKRSSLNIPTHNILWQEHCYQAKGVDDVNPRKPVLMKPLGRVFDRFPHATVENTLLIDDSPTKNALNHPDQAIHPPPYIDDNTGTWFGLQELENWLAGLRDSHKPVQQYVSRIGRLCARGQCMKMRLKLHACSHNQIRKLNSFGIPHLVL
jgi:hypothetical protein